MAALGLIGIPLEGGLLGQRQRRWRRTSEMFFALISAMRGRILAALAINTSWRKMPEVGHPLSLYGWLENKLASYFGSRTILSNTSAGAGSVTETGILRTWQPVRHACRHLHYFWWHISAALSPALDLLMELGFDPKMNSKVDIKVMDCLDIFENCILGTDRARPICLLQHSGNKIEISFRSSMRTLQMNSIFPATPWSFA